MITENDYSYIDPDFVPNSEQALSEIRIDRTSSRWCGIQFKITRISARVLEDEDNAQLSYDFTVTKYNPRYSSADALENDKDFQTFVGDILVHIIDNAFEEGDYRIGRDDDTDNNTKESASQ
jgi:hypothetical protein